MDIYIQIFFYQVYIVIKLLKNKNKLDFYNNNFKLYFVGSH